MSASATTQSTPVTGVLAAFSDELAGTVQRVGQSVARVDAGRRYPASGIVWSTAGLILTADHVIESDDDVEIGLPDGSTAKATIAARDASRDVALLRTSAQMLVPLERGPEPRVGHLALAVARPGETVATSIGVVAALSPAYRGWRGGRQENVIWTDASFYPGFGGAALVDTAGRLIGLATSTSRTGVGLALPVSTLEQIVSALQQHGHIKRAFLGIG
ncbi:MAG TPA: trypsin-like peptidase domain-containing protein, partial [Chloroflexota bacterium]|nr:trypsin-like peptidase domain-containing protein [Chloroflexota bacterium]